MLTNSDKDFLSASKYTTDHSNLLAFLDKVVLSNAECIDPKLSRIVLAAKMKEKVEKILPDGDIHVIDYDESRVLFVSPSIRDCTVDRIIIKVDLV